MIMENGMAGVTVKKDELLKALRDNLQKHQTTYLEARAGYRLAAIQELKEMLTEAEKGEPIRRGLSAVKPESHEKDYNRVIKMLEMSVKDEIFISESEFTMYVQDDWGWKQQFTAQVSNYGKAGH